MVERRQQAASDGTRSRTGCLTCRIRKKKCDERRPACQPCQSRQLACYGFDVPVPQWVTSKSSWKEVRDSTEAKDLRTLAELRYRVSRKVESRNVSPAVTTTRVSGEDQLQLAWRPLPTIPGDQFARPFTTYLPASVNVWQMRPETVWWDSKMRSLKPGPGHSSREETRLLMMFLDVIHPITHTFYKLDSGVDRRWMLDRLIETESLYFSALSVSACFEHSLTQGPSIHEIGLSSKVRRLQSESIRRLRDAVDQFSLMKTTPVEDFVLAGAQLLDAIAHLESLEIFSMLQGQWEIHHHAARRVMDHIETCSTSSEDCTSKSAVEAVLSSLPPHDARRRSLEFCILNFVWIDVLATSTFGATAYGPCAFDYVPLLDAGIIRTQDIMGCQSHVMAIVSRIARLEQWRRLMHQTRVHDDAMQAELHRRRKQLNEELDSSIRLLEREAQHLTGSSNCIGHDATLISLTWAYGAKVLLQVTTAPILPGQTDIDQTFVDICLRKLEALPTRLVMRASWPYTIAGTMASSEYQQSRFRWILGKTLQDAQPPGISWKGLIIMEECWRLRRLNPDLFFGWRDAMESLGARVILT